MREILLVLIATVFLPVLVYFCVKFGTVAFYKAKEFMKNDNN